MTDDRRAMAPKLWRFSTKHPRHALGIAWWTIGAIFVMSAVNSNNPVSMVLCLIPVPLLALLAVAEIHRALTEDAR